MIRNKRIVFQEEKLFYVIHIYQQKTRNWIEWKRTFNTKILDIHVFSRSDIYKMEWHCCQEG